jgi:predicted DNA-binding antitoxin AbrB/MazE fold protein
MKTIRAIFMGGSFKPLDPVNFPENTQFTLALLDPDDLPTDAIGELARMGGAFDFLDDRQEDIYSESDGEAV